MWSLCCQLNSILDVAPRGRRTNIKSCLRLHSQRDSTVMNVVVVGAGIIGASISKHLADRGAKVTVVESAAAPATAATGKSWAWLNANYKKPRHYRDLNLRSMQLWQQQYSHLCNFCGCVMLHDERPDPQDPAYPIQQLTTQELQVLEPALDPAVCVSCPHARLFPLEGWCDPLEATQHLLQQAQQQGAAVVYNTRVESFSTTSSSSRVTAVNCIASQQQQQQQQQSLAADAVVIAAGVGSPALAAAVGYNLPLLHKPAAVVITSPLTPGLVKHMLVTDTVFILQRTDGRFLIGETHPSEASNTDTSSTNAARILQSAAAAVPAISQATVEGMYVGFRPYPADGYPVLGWINEAQNVYIAVTHSGMTLAPLVGQLVAEEVMAAAAIATTGPTSSSSAEEWLAPYRPNREFVLPTKGDDTNWAAAMKSSKG